MITDVVGNEEIIGDDLLGEDLDDLMGDGFVGDEIDELLEGDDDEDMMGAWYNVFGKSRANRSRRDRAAIKALIAKRVRSGSIVRDTNPTKSREYVIGFGRTSVAASTQTTITVRPQVLFRPERVIIPSNIALDFSVNDIKVGKNSQFTASGAVPAVVFAETSFGVRLKMDTSQISMDLILDVTNNSANARTFEAAIIGPAVE